MPRFHQKSDLTRYTDFAAVHDCDTAERVLPDAYRANLRAGLAVLKVAAHSVAFLTTTPFDINIAKPDAQDGINMSCVLMYNSIGRDVAAEVGVKVIDLYGYVEEFCSQGTPNGHGGGPLLPRTSGFANNYTACAIQSNGLHFFTAAPQPSGQQYTALHIAAEVMKLIPNTHINNRSSCHGCSRHGPAEDVHVAPSTVKEAGEPVAQRQIIPTTALSCGDPPSPLSKTLPNVLIIGDSISASASQTHVHVMNSTIHNYRDLSHTDESRLGWHDGGYGAGQTLISKENRSHSRLFPPTNLYIKIYLFTH